MTSANGVNGDFVSDSRKLLRDILKEEWGFDGFVLTDWLQTTQPKKRHSPASTFQCLATTAASRNPFSTPSKRDVLPESEINDKARRILRIYGRYRHSLTDAISELGAASELRRNIRPFGRAGRSPRNKYRAPKNARGLLPGSLPTAKRAGARAQLRERQILRDTARWQFLGTGSPKRSLL